MKVLVINGSPKGQYSITLQTVLYLQRHFPEHSFEVLHVGQRIKALERDFTPAKDAIENAELLLFSYPIYTFIAPAQLHRFIELLKASHIDLRGKAATQLTTSKHFYDVTAHSYIQQNCHDLGLSYIKGLSADMDDLLKEKGRGEALSFMSYVQWSVENKLFEPAVKAHSDFSPAPVSVPAKNNTLLKHDIVIVTDCTEKDKSLSDMIARFRGSLGMKSRVVNLNDFPFKGGCLGCFRCAVSGKCVYSDGFDSFLRSEIQTADAIVYAFSIKDHSMGALFKTYDDRQFCNGHRTVTSGKPCGYLVSGNLENEPNLRTIIEARSEVGGNFLAGVATDEADTDKAIDRVAATLVYALDNKMTMPKNFYGVGGMKIFRDLIYTMRGMMRADHKFYKENGHYDDFPQKGKGRQLFMYLVGAMLSSEKVMKGMGNKLNEGMLMDYKKVLDKDKRKG